MTNSGREDKTMPVNRKGDSESKFLLRPTPSVRKAAENFSEKEGVSLNQFINLAVAEKLVHLQHEEWVARRPKATGAGLAKAAPYTCISASARKRSNI
jgi:hypothetical protein